MTRTITSLFVLLLSTSVSQAQTAATAPWVRATVPGQAATGLFVELKSPTAARVVGGTSAAAASVEVHEMRMEDGVMRMRALPALDLPAGQTVSLKPGSYHVMLMGLKSQLKPGDSVPVTLTIQRDDGKTEALQLLAPARQQAPGH